MGLIQLFSKNRLSKRLTDLATQIARRSEAEVWDRVSEHLLQMSMPEARGFIRARAATVIQYHVERQLVAQKEIGTQHESILIQRSTETVVNLVMSIFRQHKIGKIDTILKAA